MKQIYESLEAMNGNQNSWHCVTVAEILTGTKTKAGTINIARPGPRTGTKDRDQGPGPALVQDQDHMIFGTGSGMRIRTNNRIKIRTSNKEKNALNFHCQYNFLNFLCVLDK